MTTRLYVIWSIEHAAWWPKSRHGYVSTLGEAGHFTDAEAVAIVADANVVTINECMIPLDATAVHLPERSPQELLEDLMEDAKAVARAIEREEREKESS